MNLLALLCLNDQCVQKTVYRPLLILVDPLSKVLLDIIAPLFIGLVKSIILDLIWNQLGFAYAIQLLAIKIAGGELKPLQRFFPDRMIKVHVFGKVIVSKVAFDTLVFLDEYKMHLCLSLDVSNRSKGSDACVCVPVATVCCSKQPKMPPHNTCIPSPRPPTKASLGLLSVLPSCTHIKGYNVVIWSLFFAQAIMLLDVYGWIGVLIWLYFLYKCYWLRAQRVFVFILLKLMQSQTI